MVDVSTVSAARADNVAPAPARSVHTPWEGVQRKDIVRRLHRWRRGLWLVAVFSLLVNILMLTVPIYLLQLSDRVLVSQSLDTLYMLTIGAIGALVALTIFDAVRRFILIRMSTKLESELGGALLVASVTLGHQPGQSEAQPLRDLAGVRSFVTGPVLPLFFDIPTIPMYTGVVFLIHPHLGYIVIFGGVFIFLLALLNRAITSAHMGQGHQHSMLALNKAEAQVRNADTIRSMGMLDACLSVWGDANSNAIKSYQIASDRGALVTTASKLIRFLLQIAILGWGAFLSLNGELTAGMAIAASIIASRALGPIEGTIEGWRSYIGAREAYRRVKDALSKVSEVGERTILPDPVGNITVDRLAYHPPGAQNLIIKGLSFDVPAGTSVAVIGATGAGKSTLARLIAGAIQPVSGGVSLDGADLRSWDPLQLGNSLGFLPQSVELFPGTVAENIARMRSDASSTDVVSAAHFAGTHDLILKFPNSYETQINMDGSPLSGGQRQRVGLARAFFGQPKIVVLDEPDASLDREGEKALLETVLRAKEAGITVIMVTQRPVMLRYVDRILAIADGKIEAYSPRDQILSAIDKKKPDDEPSMQAAANDDKGHG